jgi:hypothetical protein
VDLDSTPHYANLILKKLNVAYYFHVQLIATASELHDQVYSKLAVLNLHKIWLRCFDFNLIQFFLNIIMLSDNDPLKLFCSSFTGFD